MQESWDLSGQASDEEDKEVLAKIEDAQNVRLDAEKSDNK